MKFFVIDGNSIMNRAFYGIRLLSNKKGVYTNAIFGFMNIYLKHIKEIEPDAVIAAFDLKAPTFRHKAVETYKANRKGMPDELAVQMPYIKKILEYSGASVVSCEGYEADDILGTFARLCRESGNECHILTGDRDNLQLISENTVVHLALNRNEVIYDTAGFINEYGFDPINLIDLKALMGDSSDNIPGVHGVGEKTAMKLIRQWKTVENLYDHLDEADLKPAMMTKLKNGRKDAEQSKWLATIVDNVPIDDNLEAYTEKKSDDDALCSILTELEMVQLIKTLGLNIKTNTNAEASEKKEPDIPAVLEEKEADRAFISEIDNPANSVYYLFDLKKLKVLYNDIIAYTEDKDLIMAFFESKCKKRTFSAKPHYRYAMKNGGNIANIDFDAEIGGYLLSPSDSEYTIESLCQSYGIPFCNDSAENGDLLIMPELCAQLLKKIDELGMMMLLREIELPLTEVLASMEHTGVRVNSCGVKEFGEYLSSDIEDMKNKIWEYAGHKFNILSPKQLGTVLFEELGLPAKKKTKTGYSTNADVLSELQNYHPIVELILKYRQYTKLSSTYVDGLLKEIEQDGRIHTCYKQTETRTGRISSTEPNLQNIPVRTELGSNMRKFFAADEGKVFVDADYSQIELRVLANMCGDEAMKETFLSNQDIHTRTAAQIMGLPEEFVTPSMRSAAKAVNFGIIYGMGAFSLSKDIHVSVGEAKKYISNYLSSFPKVTEFMEKVVEECRECGYVKTYFGRIRPVPELSSKNKVMQAAGRRVAMNTPIQGTAADIIKKAMICVYRRLQKDVPSAKLILQIHDELIVETEEKYKDKVAEIVQEEMQNVCSMAVPLTAEAHCGKSWYEAKNGS